MSHAAPGRRVVVVAVVVGLVASALVATAPVAAQSAPQPAWSGQLFADLESMAVSYNDAIGPARGSMDLPTRQVYNRIAGKPVNVYVHDTPVVYSFRMTSDGRIVDLDDGPRSDAVLGMSLTRATAERLVAADDPVGAFVRAVQQGRFVERGSGRTVEGVVIRGESGHVVAQVTWTVINAMKGLAFR